jgi:hypothetical protein
MEIGEQIREHVARAGLGQRPQAEFQQRENLISIRSQGSLGKNAILIAPHHGSGLESSWHESLAYVEWTRRNLFEEPRALLVCLTHPHEDHYTGLSDVAFGPPRPCIIESHRGVVSDVLGNQVEITYETPAGPIKQIYNREQFRGGVIPNEGDDVEAKVTVSVVDRETSEVEEDFESDIPSFEGRGIKGQARI